MQKQGNALFLILIAVALFAALSYAITTSSRGSVSDNKERASLAIAQLLQYSAHIQSAVNRMQIVGGYQPWQMSFACSDLSPTGNNFCHGNGVNAACTEDACRVFEGGWATPVVPGPEAFIPDASVSPGVFARRQFMSWIEISGVGTSTPDIALVFYGLSDEACEELNFQSGLGRTIPVDPYSRVSFTNWSGAPPTVGTNIVGETATELAGKRTFCIDHSGMRTFHYVIAEF